jgi:hypothetical protein
VTGVDRGPWFVPYVEAKFPNSWPSDGWCEVWREVDGGFMLSIEPSETSTRRKVFCNCKTPEERRSRMTEPALWPEELDEGRTQPRKRSLWRRLLDRVRATEERPGNY